MEVVPILAGEDNYIYLVQSGSAVLVIDPTAAEPVLRELSRRQLSLTHILITHHHYDHIAGLASLKAKTGACVIAGETRRIPGVDRVVVDGEYIPIEAASVEVLSTPGHGDADLSYCIRAPDSPDALFCGDTLFVSGCGRVIEGTFEQLWNSIQRIAALPDAALIYCGHEYTVDNLRFACAMYPEDHEYRDQLRAMQSRVEQGGCTVPSSIRQEKQSNPFLRATSLTDFKSLRQQKDRF